MNHLWEKIIFFFFIIIITEFSNCYLIIGLFPHNALCSYKSAVSQSVVYLSGPKEIKNLF